MNDVQDVDLRVPQDANLMMLSELVRAIAPGGPDAPRSQANPPQATVDRAPSGADGDGRGTPHARSRGSRASDPRLRVGTDRGQVVAALPHP
jgi:hypothetical protein